MKNKKIRRLQNDMEMESVLGAHSKVAKFSLLVINSIFKEISCLVVLLFGFF